jgi:hypothetical protein
MSGTRIQPACLVVVNAVLFAGSLLFTPIPRLLGMAGIGPGHAFVLPHVFLVIGLTFLFGAVGM